MSKMSTERIISELNARRVDYRDDMKYDELWGLLKKARDGEKAVEAKAKVKEQPINYTGQMCGLGTIHDHHRRITLIERKLGIEDA